MNDSNYGFVPEGQPLGVPPLELTAEENARIDAEFEGLIDDYLHTRKGDKVDVIRKVFEFARKAHGNNRRHSGQPYILHPLATARIVAAKIGLGSTTISAALLHDVIPYTSATIEEMEAAVGTRITSVVRGLNLISGGNIRFFVDEGTNGSINDLRMQAENFRKLLLTICEDVRVILVKIADRLDNMRTLSFLPEDKQRRIASETLYLYAPIADRLGLYNIKTELEDLSLRYEHPDEYFELKQQMQDAEAGCDRLFKTFIAPISSLIDDLGLTYTFQYRMKTVYSIWRKMKAKHISFDEVYDLFAARIVFTPSSPQNEKVDCWRIYAAITSIYKVHPDRIRDWISHPKPSGYEALQLTVMGPTSNWIEVQIRSDRMNENAEEGIAAHWRYKQGNKATSGDNTLDKWLGNIKEILEDPEPDATSFLDTIKLSVLSSSIYVFTPTGDLKEMPKGATALDFAFVLHTKIGLAAEAARINHELQPLSTVLESSDQVEIITADHETVSPEWLGFLHTTKARSRVSTWLNKQRKAVADKGEKQIRDILAQDNIELTNDLMITLLNHYGANKWEDLFYRFGTGELQIDESFRQLARPKKKHLLGFLDGFSVGNIVKRKPTPKTKPVEPAHPHGPKPPSHTALQPKTSTIELRGIDGVGLLNTITQVISKTCTANIINIHLECKEGLFKGYITLDTGDPVLVQRMCTALKKIHEVQKAVKL